MTAPVADVVPVTRELHGTVRVDDYAWLNERKSARTAAYLVAERAYYDSVTAHTRPLRQRLFDEMANRTVPTDRSVSWSRGDLVYYTETVAGKEYEQFYRVETTESAAKLLLDENLLAEGAEYFALGMREVSPDGRLLAYSVDREGDEVYVLKFRDLDTGIDLPDTIERTYYGGAWSADSSSFWYIVHDEAYRPFQVWRHQLGTAPSQDRLVLADDDERFEVTLDAARSGDCVVVHSTSKDATEAWLLSTSDPDLPARLVQPRIPGLEYHVTYASRADGDALVIVTNHEAPEFRLMTVSVDSPGLANWTELVGEDPAERLYSADVFADQLVLTLRRGGEPCLRIMQRNGSLGALDIHPGVPAGSIRLDRNEDYATDHITVVVESYSEPEAWFDVDLVTGTRTLRKRQEVPGYDTNAYISELRQITAADGSAVPVTIVRRADTPLDGTAPCLLYGYGAYEYCFEPEFDPALSVLLDQGVVFAHAQVRGGGELGRRWHVAGSLANKQNSFGDFVAVADGLSAGVVAGIVARGLSAGGLLMGAVYSQAPKRWAGVVAEVPFVDVVTTMLDETIPLTAQEWDEWGDPRRAEDFAWMLAYSPYDNLPVLAERPPLLVTGALHDSRVMYWEPTKWVAKLRATGSTDERVVLRMETGAGAHAGPSGRFAHLEYEAEIYAWVLETLGRSSSR